MSDDFGTTREPEFEDGDATTPTPPKPDKPLNLLTAKKARKGREIEERGWVFQLVNTIDENGEPQEAHVRRVTLGDKDVVASLSANVQQQLMNLLDSIDSSEDIGRNSGRRNPQKKQRTAKRLLRNLAQGEEQADILCIAGFLSPRLYLTQDEAEANDGVWVKDIHKADRMIFARICNGDQEVIQDRMTPFSGQTPDEPVDAVFAVSGVSDVAEHGATEQSHPTPTRLPTPLGTYSG